jgi:hypothetical protein
MHCNRAELRFRLQTGYRRREYQGAHLADRERTSPTDGGLKTCVSSLD